MVSLSIQLLPQCLELDDQIANADVVIANFSKLAVKNASYKPLLAEWQTKRIELQKRWVQLGCVEKLEQKKALESADILSSNFALTEQDLLPQANKQKNQLLLLGGGALLIGLYLIIKK